MFSSADAEGYLMHECLSVCVRVILW